MLKHIIKIAYRNLIKQRSYSLINLFGLALGMTCCLLILATIGYELSYDGYHKTADRIYRIASRQTIAGTTTQAARSPAPVGPAMIRDFPEVMDAVRFSPTVKRAFNYRDRHFFQENVFYADQSVFNVFSFELIAGDPDTALEAPFTMVITESTARKYFGDENPMGKVVNWDNKFDYQVTGVVKDPPPNSHFTFTVLASFSTFIKYDPRIGSWRGGSFPTYLLLRPGTDPLQFERKIEDFNVRYLGPMLKEIGAELETFLQPLKSIHLHSHLIGELGANSDIRIIYTLAAIAAVILLMACINFVNLATARAAGRGKEVGLRKVLGAKRRRLVVQFLGESFLFTLLSAVLAVFAARLVLPQYRALSGRDITLDFLQVPAFAAGLAGIILLVGFAAGSYPALFLSSFQPVAALKGQLRLGSRGAWFRSALVVFQFTFSSVLIIGTMVIFKQQQYMQSQDLGFEKENLYVIALQNDEVRIALESFKNELLEIEGVAKAGASSMIPGEMYLFNYGVYPQGLGRDQVFLMDNFLVDHGFLDTFEVEVVKGRGFSRLITTDAAEAVMINETAARTLEWDDPIGKTIEIPAGDHPVRKTVIGVFRDIHQRSLYSRIDPTFIQYVGTEGPIENRARRLSLRLQTVDPAVTTAAIERKWKEFFPDHPYYAFYLDEFYDGQHRAEQRLGSLYRAFAGLAVAIGCLGLLGLASFTAQRRTREIGIRKVLGSSTGSVVALLVRKYIALIAIANLLAWPVAFYAMHRWLENFPYPVSLDAGAFVVAALLTLLAALLAVGRQSLKAAHANPADSLRYE